MKLSTVKHCQCVQVHLRFFGFCWCWQWPTYWQSARTWSILCQITPLFFLIIFSDLAHLSMIFPWFVFHDEEWKMGSNDEKPYIYHSNHHSIRSWHQFDLKIFTDNYRHLNIPYTDLEEDLRSSEQDRDDERRGYTERDQFQVPLTIYSDTSRVF